jgi:uracil-DNA glycosylase
MVQSIIDQGDYSELPMDWIEFLSNSNAIQQWELLRSKVDELYRSKSIFPTRKNLFRAFHLTPVSSVKCVFIGQDPYHGFGQANGLAFSVDSGVTPPPSLKNILKELVSDMGLSTTVLNKTDLSPWAKEGVLLLNLTLTVEEKKPNSHSDLGWKSFSESIVASLAQSKNNIVYILLGNFANNLKNSSLNRVDSIITSVHPSPLSAYRGFFGSRIFSRTNEFLLEKAITPINWNL